ncbi:RNA-directed DNA polymerase, eukaryota, partial [Tanacetum coccineum]
MAGHSYNEINSRRGRSSNEDLTQKISHSIFVTNFPVSVCSRDLWKVCSTYGTVVDVFIPSKLSKAGKRFAFVRFIKVFNLDRLVENLCTLWIGSHHLFANHVRFDRPSKPKVQNIKFPPKNGTHQVQGNGNKQSGSFVSAVKGIPQTSAQPFSLPALVLDDSCLVTKDLDNCVMGEVRQFSSINNLHVLLHNEGFPNVEIAYLGGLWVMIKLGSSNAKHNLMKHVGVASWFVRLCKAQSDFVANDRIVWIDIEGVPLHAWSRNTFQKIGSKWGEVMELEEDNVDLFARKRLCIKTNQADNILESFKIIVKGKVFRIRAKELFVWSPSFKKPPEVEHSTNDESVEEDIDNIVHDNNLNNLDEESDKDAVSETCFGDNGAEQDYANEVDQQHKDKETSYDPFNIYELLNKGNKDNGKSGTESSIPFPPGFTPDQIVHDQDKHDVREGEAIQSINRFEDCNSRVFEEVEKPEVSLDSNGRDSRMLRKEGGSILDALEEMIKGLGSKAKKEWIRELTSKLKISFLTLQETKKEMISAMEIKFLWGNYSFEHIVGEALGNSGGILCAWDPNIFLKHHHIISDNFVALFGTWIPKKIQVLIISVYASQSFSSKCILWNFISSLISRWNGESIVMGDFNEVRCKEERWGSNFHTQGANSFNSFISRAGLYDIQLEGYSFTWVHPSAGKMSKLDRFLVTDGLLSSFPNLSAVCLDKHLSDHRPILLREILVDFGAIPFRMYHSWFSLSGFDQMITSSWNSFNLDDSNSMIRFRKKLQLLKKEIRSWVSDYKKKQTGRIRNLKDQIRDIDILVDQGGVTDDMLLSRLDLSKQLQDLSSLDHSDFIQKAKVRWAVEGDENSKFFHGIINRKRTNLSVKGIMVDGEWVDDPSRIKKEFHTHFADRFKEPGLSRGKLNFFFPNRLCREQADDLELMVSNDEIRKAVWGCGENKSPGPDGYTFEFFRKFWTTIGPDFCSAVQWFFEHGAFAAGCNSSFVTLIPKILNPKLVSDFRPISLIGSIYKVITKILASRLSNVISDLISNVQTAFLLNPYDSIRWDYLDDVLIAFGFGRKWCSWIQASLRSGKASILVNGSPSSEFHLHRGLKQGDPLAPLLFILIMESFHLSFSRAVEAEIFNGFRIDNSLRISHLFYADDAIFIGEWSNGNLK